MRQALLLIQTKGQPDQRVVGDFGSVKTKFKALSVPDTHATLYELHRVNVKHVPAASVPVTKQEPVLPPVLQPVEPKPTQKKGK